MGRIYRVECHEESVYAEGPCGHLHIGQVLAGALLFRQMN